MAKIVLKKTIKKTNAPEVNESVLEEVELTPETIEEVKERAKEMKEELTQEQKFIKWLEKIVEAQILGGGNRFLWIESVIATFRSATKI